MTAWLAATVALGLALVVPLYLACRGLLVQRFVAVQLAGALVSLTLSAMSFAFDQPSFIDLPLTLAILSLPGTLAMALFVERWL